jgi:hypothetical protein
MKKPFDILAEFGKFGLERKMSLRDPAAPSAFIAHVGEAIERALADPALLQGQRVEAMFEALLVSLGDFKLLKAEDGGRLFPTEGFRSPDFRVVLNDGAHWLIEVKNVYEVEPQHQRRLLFTKAYYKTLAAYASATGAELKVAVFWARWSIWTLVSPDRLIGEDGFLELDMETAIRVNELSRLGDRMIGTRSPMRLRITTNPERTSQIGVDGNVFVTIGGVQIFSGDVEVTDPVEQQIAWIFMQYGEWKESSPNAVIDGDRLLAMEFLWAPETETNQGFEMVGTLSRMFARYNAVHTVDDNAVVQLRAPQRPNWFAPLVQHSYQSHALPLWRFILQPNHKAPTNLDIAKGHTD